MDKFKIGVVSFTDPRAVEGIGDIEKKNIEYQDRLIKVLKKAGLSCCVPLKKSCVNDRAAADRAVRAFLSEEVDALVFGCWKWTDPMLAVDVARRVDRPLMLAGEDDEASTPLGCIAAVGAALWEIAPNENAANHSRVIGDFAKIAAWARGAGALAALRRKSLLLWGGSYCLKMPHLEDDPSALKRFLVGDILTEDQFFLTAGAEKILAKQRNRAARFLKWFEKGGTEIVFDGKRSTPDSLMKQAALYLAARDRLAELGGENIGGVSVKCQPALSELFGATGCLIPALLPFGEDAEGEKPALPTVCEGDIKGLVTSMLLQLIAGGTPPGFGDIRHIEVGGKLLLIISNCGGASIYYAKPGAKAKDVLPNIYLKPQCQGAAGCAVGYKGPSFGTATIARLIRRRGEYIMQYALGDSVAVTDKIIARLGWGDVWPVSLFDIGMDLGEFTSAMGSNHYSFVPGDFSGELKFACAAAGIKMENLNGKD